MRWRPIAGIGSRPNNKNTSEETLRAVAPSIELAGNVITVRALSKRYGALDGVDGDVSLICAKPLDDTRVGARFRRLAENVCVDQVFHSESVDSASTGTKKPFSGHVSSQSTAPSLGRAARRTRRYSPRSRRSTSNS